MWLQHSFSARVAHFTHIGNCSFSPLVKQIAIYLHLEYPKEILQYFLENLVTSKCPSFGIFLESQLISLESVQNPFVAIYIIILYSQIIEIYLIVNISLYDNLAMDIND